MARKFKYANSHEARDAGNDAEEDRKLKAYLAHAPKKAKKRGK